MSSSYAFPAERSSSGIARRWLLAYVISQLICMSVSALAAALAQAAGWPAGSPGFFSLNLAVALTYGLTFGYLRGCVLRELLAGFPMRTWCVVIAGVALASVLVSTPGVGTTPAPPAAAMTVHMMMRAVIPVAFAGVAYGIVIGVVEAFVLRRAAQGLFAWILISGLAWAGGLLVMMTGAMLLLSRPDLSPFEMGAIGVLTSLLKAFVVGLLMLPALRVLTPKLRA